MCSNRLADQSNQYHRAHMIQTTYNRSLGGPLYAAILDEIVVSHAAQVVIDELGLAMATHPGFKRSRNEDRIAVARIEASAETYTVALLCDGVGGSESGDQAAALAIASVIGDLAQQQGRPPLKELAAALVRQADDQVRKTLHGSGSTTLVMLLGTASGLLVCANVGDSRAYSWDPVSSKLNQVTTDDTIENELRNLPGNPEALINARGLRGRLSQALGEGGRTPDDLRVQIYTKEQFRSGAVIGSDGLWRAAKDFESSVANASSPTDAIRRAIALANWVGGVDNSSVIALADFERFCSGSASPASAGRRYTDIALWTTLNKVKLFPNIWTDQGKPAQTRARPERQKKTTRKKDPHETLDEPQLGLEAVISQEAKPMIEVTISEDSKKSE